jgi:hypothetical protein
MNTANLENCKKLYELSGWGETEYLYGKNIVSGNYPLFHQDNYPQSYPYESSFPAYDLGYLIRKLPQDLKSEPDKDNRCEQWGLRLETPIVNHTSGLWAFYYENSKPYIWQEADTPEDALCLLAIKLFEEGILKKEQ